MEAGEASRAFVVLCMYYLGSICLPRSDDPGLMLDNGGCAGSWCQSMNRVSVSAMHTYSERRAIDSC